MSNASSIIAYSFFADFAFCPSHLDKNSPPECKRASPKILDYDAQAISNNNTVFPDLESRLTTDNITIKLDPSLAVPTTNFLHLAHSFIRLDIGHIRPNFLTNLSVIDEVLTAELPVPVGAPPGSAATPSWMYNAWKSQRYYDDTNVTFASIKVPGPSTLRAVFQCRSLQLKSSGTLVVSVLVATLSMFATIWGLGLLALALFAKQGDTTGERV